ncbi:HIT domain-containing protein [Candidatus Dependentiae bacterium]|nr:MAG: HIT domain-containing protein [Candidatus Dependentiae bacterium]
MQSTSSNCIFCKIIEGLIPADIIVQNEHAIVIKDIFPKAPIHYLIIPKLHVADVAHLNANQYEIGTQLFCLAQQVGSSLPNKQDFRLIINNGANAGQSVFHLHMHFLSGMPHTGLTDVEL